MYHVYKCVLHALYVWSELCVLNAIACFGLDVLKSHCPYQNTYPFCLIHTCPNNSYKCWSLHTNLRDEQNGTRGTPAIYSD